jgi:lysophospholipase L1-like esterase
MTWAVARAARKLQLRVIRSSRRTISILLLIVIAVLFLLWKRNQSGAVVDGVRAKSAHVGQLQFLALGDSYTIGQSVMPSESWPMQLAGKIRAKGLDLSDPIIIARTGWTTGDLMAAVDAAQLADSFDLVVLLIGVNNQFQGRSEDEYREQFALLLKMSIELARGNVRHVVVLSIPDWSVMPFGQQFDVKRVSGQIDEFNAICRQETAKAGAGFVDVCPVSREATSRPDFVAEDGLHPSGVQYARWVDLSIPAVQRAIGVAKP